MENDSILDKVIATAKEEELSSFNLASVLQEMLLTLPERERDILSLRYGIFHPQKSTLEFIGNKYNITRERVRQIEGWGVKKLKQLLQEREDFSSLFDVVEVILRDLGGITTHSNLIAKIKDRVAGDCSDNEIDFVLSKLLKDKLIEVKGGEVVMAGWCLPDFNMNFLLSMLAEVERILADKSQLMSDDELWQAFKQSNFFQRHDLDLSVDRERFFSLLKMSNRVKANVFGEWGLGNWSLVKPKRMNDKIYLVLRQAGKPLHFRQIADKINEVGFDHKKAHPATVHNELILDTKRYVLVGRGIYALKEWGYKPGIVSDIIALVLKEAGRPLTKQEIIDLVKKQRMVKEATIVLALVNKGKFKKMPDGKYTLADE